MVRYFFTSVAVAAVGFLAMRFAIGEFVLPGVEKVVARDLYFLFPALVAGVVTSWLTRPAVRGQTFVGPLFATALFPFIAGSIFSAFSTVFGRSAEETADFAGSIEQAFYTAIDAPLFVVETLPISIPLALIAVVALRRSDPVEKMREKMKGQTPASANPFRN